MAYIKDMEHILPQIEKEGGKAVIITAQSADKLPGFLAKTKFSGETIVDEDTKLVTELKNRNFVNVAVSDKGGYPHGMIQPAVLVLRKDTPLYSWAIKPSMVCICCFSCAIKYADFVSDEPRRGEGPRDPERSVGGCPAHAEGSFIQAPTDVQ